MPSRRSWILCLCALLLCLVHLTTASPAVSRVLNETIIIFDDEGTTLTIENDTEEHGDLGASEEHGTGGESETHQSASNYEGDEEHEGEEHEGEEHEGEEHNEAAHAVLFPVFSLTLGLIVFFILTR